MKRPALALLAAAGLALTGCVSQTDVATESTATDSPSLGTGVKFTCDPDGSAVTLPSLQEVWKLPSEKRWYCVAELSSDYELTPTDASALALARIPATNRADLAKMFTMCATYNFNVTSPSELISAPDDTLEGINTLCPGHPEEKTLQTAIETQNKKRAEASASASAEAKASAEAEAKQEALEAKALSTAYGDEADDSSLSSLQSLCAEPMLGYGDNEMLAPDDLSESQGSEVRGALILCPDHKDAKAMKANLKASERKNDERANGTRFTGGDYRVGKDIKPGTYVVESDEAFEGCYWSRLNKNGDIIQNNFINSGFRAQVTIRATDYSFSSNDCGEWVRQ